VVFCLGVIQHIPDPEATIACLYNQVRPRGTLAIDHCTYSVSGWSISSFRFTNGSPTDRSFGDW
jgi:2-polyprenyl-3-methyl-5-hydroxy-6-metoxy-1,4-benzoquinol methylase